MKPTDSETRFGAVPNSINLSPKLSGTEFARTYTRRVEGTIDGQIVNLISSEDFLTNKKASGRLPDLADLEPLSPSP